jgi:4'-phosphopantetheinyl transferase
MNGISVEVRLWSAAPENLALETDVIHVWCASLVVSAARVQSLLRTLAPDEISRADRFYFPKDRERFIVARGLLRLILSRYLEMEPSQVRFCYGKHGKPALAEGSVDDALRFNLSHSNGLALYAITHGREIGVDIEYMRADFPGLEVADQFFSAREVGILRALPPGRRQEVFFTLWTLKEAYVKARGGGLTESLAEVDVSAVLGEAVSLLRISGDTRDFSPWLLQRLAPAPGYSGALAVEARVEKVSCPSFGTT